MRRAVSLLCIAALLLAAPLLAGCRRRPNYVFTQMLWQGRAVTAEYPLLSGLEDAKALERANEIIRAAAFAEPADGVPVSRTYLVERADDRFSVLFTDTADGVPVRFFAVTVDMKRGARLSLADCVGADRTEDLLWDREFIAHDAYTGEVRSVDLVALSKVYARGDRVSDFFLTEAELRLILQDGDRWYILTSPLS